MQIVVGKTSGFCYGVKRAVEGAKKELNTYSKIDCLGEIVHNKQVNSDLESKGLKFIDNIEQSCGTTIIRTHGVPKSIYEIAKRNNIELKDYTCPNVLKVQNIAQVHCQDGYYIFLTGSKKHPEVKGIVSHCENNYTVLESKEDIEEAISKFKISNLEKILLISQTTYSLKKFSEIEEILKKVIDKNTEFKIKNTICNTTELRQKETEELSKKMDYMIIIGGKNSLNTQKLYDIAKLNCANSICIETSEELNAKEVKKHENIGIMAGASTPQKSIEEVICMLKT